MGKSIDFEPIPNEGQDPKNPRYYTALSIYPPGEFIQNDGFAVFVGGCGVGERDTLEEAMSYLFDRAMLECERRISAGQQTVNHYREQMRRLLRDGIGRKDDNSDV